MTPNTLQRIWIAEDDADDRLMIQEAFMEIEMGDGVVFFHDGQDLMQRLNGLVESQHRDGLPHLVVLDLNMPRKDGREALREIKADVALRFIPVVILTTSKSPEDIRNAYALGANCYITKPVTFESLLATVQAFHSFWFGVARLPV
ncbi:MAG TPA: response regulator [Chitinophagales bacterium]|nr:response regulator [Chitinophagales bacterium]